MACRALRMTCLLTCTLALLLGGFSADLLSSAAAQAPKKIPKPEEVDLISAGVVLKATYYEGLDGKNSAPVIMIHSLEGSRSEYHTAALVLQEAGHTIIVPDLRGHGDSKAVQGSDKTIDIKDMRPSDYAGFGSDIEACKKFLVDKHNEGKCNIDKLCLVGAEAGGILAINYAAADYAVPVLSTGKQGQDVKAIALLSPERSHKTMNCNAALGFAPIQKFISFYILVGDRGSAGADARRIFQTIERGRKAMDREDENDLVLSKIATSLQGAKMLQLGKENIPQRMVLFFKERAVDQPFPWKERRNPFGN